MKTFEYELKAMSVIRKAAKKSKNIPVLIGENQIDAVANYIKENNDITVEKIEELVNE